MNSIQDNFKLKYDNIEYPYMYLRAKFSKMFSEGSKTCCKMLSDPYVKAVVVNVEDILARGGRRLPKKCVTPFSSKYSPWLEEWP